MTLKRGSRAQVANSDEPLRANWFDSERAITICPSVNKDSGDYTGFFQSTAGVLRFAVAEVCA
jgi:hypothetical protein